MIIPDCIDEAVFCLIHAVDDGRVQSTYTESGGQKVDLNTEGLGELAGWYMGAESWRDKFSRERVNDYLS